MSPDFLDFQMYVRVTTVQEMFHEYAIDNVSFVFLHSRSIMFPFACCMVDGFVVQMRDPEGPYEGFVDPDYWQSSHYSTGNNG